MSNRMRVLVLFAVATPVAAIAASRLKPRPHARLTLPNPPVVVEEVDSRQSTVNSRMITPAPILPSTVPAQPEESDPQDDFSIDGLAVDPAGRPIPFARLWARGLEGQVVAIGKADEEGKFTLVGRSPQPLFVYAQAGNRRGMVGPIDVDRDPLLRVIVAAPARMRGVLVDARGVPVVGAWIHAGPYPSERLDEYPEPDGFHSPEATTDAAGQFTLELPAPGLWDVTATRAEACVAAQLVQVLGGDRDVVLRVGDTEPLEQAHEIDLEGDGGEWQAPLAATETDGGLIVLAATADGALLPGDIIRRIDGRRASRYTLLGDENTTADLEVERPATRQVFRTRVARSEHIEDEGGC